MNLHAAGADLRFGLFMQDMEARIANVEFNVVSLTRKHEKLLIYEDPASANSKPQSVDQSPMAHLADVKPKEFMKL